MITHINMTVEISHVKEITQMFHSFTFSLVWLVELIGSAASILTFSYQLFYHEEVSHLTSILFKVTEPAHITTGHPWAMNGSGLWESQSWAHEQLPQEISDAGLFLEKKNDTKGNCSSCSYFLAMSGDPGAGWGAIIWNLKVKL